MKNRNWRHFAIAFISFIALDISGCGEVNRVFKNDSKDADEQVENPSNETPNADAIAWPRAAILNEADFNRGIPEGDLAVEFEVEGEGLDEFEIRCRAASVNEIEKADKKSCKEEFEIKDYDEGQLYRFEVFAVHKPTEAEHLLVMSEFRTDPIAVVVVNEPVLWVQYTGIVYLELTVSPPREVYFTCSTVSDLSWDPTMDCRNGLLLLDINRFNGPQRLRIMAWDIHTNERLAIRTTYFCSGFLCARSIGPGAPPPYGPPE